MIEDMQYILQLRDQLKITETHKQNRVPHFKSTQWSANNAIIKNKKILNNQHKS